MLASVEHFNFAGLTDPVAFVDSGSLYPYLKTIMRDWGIDRIEPDDSRPPVITIQKTGAGFERRSKWLSKPAVFSDPVDAACDMIVDVIHAYVADHKDMLCLHCAAVEFNRGLVVFPNTYRAGKSTFSLKLVESGGRLFTDDVLPISNQGDAGLALGILPRLRLPLPDQISSDFANFIKNRCGPHNDRYLYVRLGLNEQAALGTTAPIRGITILQREKNAEPQLSKVKRSTVGKDMILRNFARQNPGLEIVDRLYAVVDKAVCYRLQYDNLEQASNLLKEVFG